jgi:hypothetical protein
MTKLSRKVLKGYFKNGSMPSEEQFDDLIDSSVNILDDGFSKSPGGGLLVAPEDMEGTTQTQPSLVSFFTNTESLNNGTASWLIGFTGSDSNPSLAISQPGAVSPAFIMMQNGNAGLNITTPVFTLDVGGIIGMQGRVGTYLQQEARTVPADGKWHAILTSLDSLQGFEIMAAVYGVKGSGRYALLHAIALSAFGDSRSRINKTSAWYGRRKHRLDLRWTGKTHDYNLEIKTHSDMGEGILIKYYITKLWWEGL